MRVCSSVGPAAQKQGQITGDCCDRILNSDKWEFQMETDKAFLVKALHVWKLKVC